jgi:hypothetical protein
VCCLAMLSRRARPHTGLVLVWVADGELFSEAAAVAAILAVVHAHPVHGVCPFVRLAMGGGMGGGHVIESNCMVLFVATQALACLRAACAGIPIVCVLLEGPAQQFRACAPQRVVCWRLRTFWLNHAALCRRVCDCLWDSLQLPRLVCAVDLAGGHHCLTTVQAGFHLFAPRDEVLWPWGASAD